MEKLTIKELENLSHHTLETEKVKEFANPFNGCWIELKSPITKEEVKACIDKCEQELTHTPSWIEVSMNPTKWPEETIRSNHIKKIAFFATNEMEKPISIDVGIPSLGCYVDYIIDDGNHRLAGAIYKGDLFIKAKVSGDVNHAKELDLWNPNKYEKELNKRYEEEMKNRQNNNNKSKIKPS